MERYSFLRAFADSWVLLALVVLFIAVILFAWRPGSRRGQDDAAKSIFRNERQPAPESDDDAPGQHDNDDTPGPEPRETDQPATDQHKADRHEG